jgi:DNA-binding transcriptional ArsR family regulator
VNFIVAAPQWGLNVALGIVGVGRYMNSHSGISHPVDSAASNSRWYFLTNHAHVLVCVAHDPGIRLRDIAESVGITERSAHKILSELVEEGYVLRERQGRRNRYEVRPELPLRHHLVEEREIGELLEVLLRSRAAEKDRSRSDRVGERSR